MIVYPTAPLPGERVSATLIREIIRCLRAITPLPGPGVEIEQGPNGSHIKAAKPKRPKVTVDRSCWAIGSYTDTDSGITFPDAFINRYYKIGERIYEMPFAMAGETTLAYHRPPEGEECIVAVCLMLQSWEAPFPFIQSFRDFAAIDEFLNDDYHAVIPLYKIDHNLGILVDFRTMPGIVAFEYGNEQEFKS